MDMIWIWILRKYNIMQCKNTECVSASQSKSCTLLTDQSPLPLSLTFVFLCLKGNWEMAAKELFMLAKLLLWLTKQPFEFGRLAVIILLAGNPNALLLLPCCLYVTFNCSVCLVLTHRRFTKAKKYF